MALNNPTSQFWLINISLAIFLLAMLVDWLSFCIISFIGIILGITLHYVIIPHSIQAIHCEAMYNFIYIVIYSTTIGFIFNKRKELVSTARFNTAKNIAGTMMHEIKSPLLTLALINNNIKRKINNQDDIGTLKKILPRIDQVITETEYLVANILAKLKKDSSDIKLELLSIKHEINVIIDSYPFIKDEQNKVILSINYNFSFLGDSSLFKHVIHNLLKNSLYYTRSNSNAKIYITSERINEYNYLFLKIQVKV